MHGAILVVILSNPLFAHRAILVVTLTNVLYAHAATLVVTLTNALFANVAILVNAFRRHVATLRSRFSHTGNSTRQFYMSPHETALGSATCRHMKQQ